MPSRPTAHLDKVQDNTSSFHLHLPPVASSSHVIVHSSSSATTTTSSSHLPSPSPSPSPSPIQRHVSIPSNALFPSPLLASSSLFISHPCPSNPSPYDLFQTTTSPHLQQQQPIDTFTQRMANLNAIVDTLDTSKEHTSFLSNTISAITAWDNLESTEYNQDTPFLDLLASNFNPPNSLSSQSSAPNFISSSSSSSTPTTSSPAYSFSSYATSTDEDKDAPIFLSGSLTDLLLSTSSIPPHDDQPPPYPELTLSKLSNTNNTSSFSPFQALLTTDPFTCASPILDPSDPFTLPTDPLNPFDISNLPSTLSTFQHANSLAALVALNDTLDQGWQYAEHFITDHPDPEPQDPITSSITSLSQTIISSSSNNKLRVTPKTPKSLEGTGAQAFRLSPMKPKTPTQRKKRVVPYVTRKPPKPTPTPSTTADSLTLSFQRLHATLQSTNSPTTAVQFINDATDGNPKSSPGHDLEGIRRRSKPVTPRKRKPRVNEASSAPEKTSDEGFERLLFGCADEMDFTTLEMMGMREEMLTIPCAAVRPELVTAPSAMTKESVVVERVVHEDLLGPAMEEVEVDEAEQNFLTFLDADEDEMTGFEMTESDILL